MSNELSRFVIKTYEFEKKITESVQNFFHGQEIRITGDPGSYYRIPEHSKAYKKIPSGINPPNSKEQKLVLIPMATLYMAIETVFGIKTRLVTESITPNLTEVYCNNLLAPLKNSIIPSKKEIPNAEVTIIAPSTTEELLTEILKEEKAIRENQKKEAKQALNSLEIKQVESDDGFQIKYFIGDSKKRKLILVNAFGLPHNIWMYVVAYFSKNYCVILWEERGGKESDQNLSLTNQDHVQDLKAIMKAEGIEKADFMCWCSGMRIMAEYFRHYPQTVNSMAIIAGYFEYPGDEAQPRTPYDMKMRNLCKLLIENPELLDTLQGHTKRFFDHNFKKSGGENQQQGYDPDFLKELIGSATTEVKDILITPFLNKQTFLNYAVMVDQPPTHNQLEYLETSMVPTLIVNADNDTIVSGQQCSIFESGDVPHVKLGTLTNSTHWCLWEDHDIVNPLLEKHLWENPITD